MGKGGVFGFKYATVRGEKRNTPGVFSSKETFENMEKGEKDDQDNIQSKYEVFFFCPSAVVSSLKKNILFFFFLQIKNRVQPVHLSLIIIKKEACKMNLETTAEADGKT